MIIVQLLIALNSLLMFDFDRHSDLSNWFILNDDVMGGKSAGKFFINSSGNGQFEGLISLDNYGGFSSVRYRFDAMQINEHKQIVLKIKGDGKNYQLRLKNKANDYYSYIYEFATTEDWIEVEIPLEEMYPSFRGRKLNMANFDHSDIEELGILIGNKKAEYFKLEIDKIELR